LNPPFVLVLAFCNLVYAASLCPIAKSKGEGSWPILETAFNSQTALRELKKLGQTASIKSEMPESFVWGNSLLYVEGWLLKKNALERKSKGELQATKEFCEFMKTRAFLRH
jgi:hypothetical protein